MLNLRAVKLWLLAYATISLLIACNDSGGSTSTPKLSVTGNVGSSICLPDEFSVTNGLFEALKVAGYNVSVGLEQFQGCSSGIDELFDYLGNDAVAVDPEGEVLGQGDIDANGLFGFTVDTSSDTLFGVVLAEEDSQGNLLCLQPLDYQMLADNNQTAETTSALFGFNAGSRQSVDLGRFTFNEFSATAAADLTAAPDERLQPGSSDFDRFSDGVYLNCGNSSAVETQVSALFGFEIPVEAQEQAIDIDDFAFVLALRLLEDGRYEFVSAGTLDEAGNLDLRLVTDSSENLDNLRFIVADAGFFDERKLDYPPMPIFDTALFGFNPTSQQQQDTLDLGTLRADFAFIEAHVQERDETPVPDANVIGIIQQGNDVSLNLTKTDDEGLWQMFIPPGADYSFVAFDDENTILGGRTVNIDEPRRFGPSDADITVDSNPGNEDCNRGFTIDAVDSAGDVAALAGCTTIQALSISGSTLENLTGLENLRVIVGSLFIGSNDALKNLTGLSNLSSVGDFLSIRYNPSLEQVDDLANLSTLGTGVFILNNDNLLHLDGLSSVAIINNQLEIDGNATLINIEGLSAVTSIGDYVLVRNNPSLDNVDGFENLSSVGTDVRIGNNNSLRDVDGLMSLSTVEGNLLISDNNALTNVNGLAGIASVKGNLSIFNNDSLANLDGLSSLNTVASTTTISGNQALDCSPYNTPPYPLPFFPVDHSTGNLVNCVTSD